MIKNKIGIDIDGVLSNVVRAAVVYARDKYGIEFNADDVTEYDFSKCTPLSDSQVSQMLNDPEFYEIADPIIFAPLSTSILFNAGFTIFLVTARPPETRPVTVSWLRRHKVHFTKLKFEKNKANVAFSYLLDYFVEDNRETAIQLSTIVEDVYLVDAPYNRGEIPSNVHRVGTWSDILSTLARIGQQESP